MALFVSSNIGKVKEMRSILGEDLKAQSLDLTEIQSTDFKQIVEHKLLQAFEHFNQPVLVEDTGMKIDAYGKILPGPFIKFFLDSMTLDQICIQAQESLAKVVTMIGYFNGASFLFCVGETKGKISHTPKGENGFGFDPIFVPNGSALTLAEMNLDQKNIFSSRRKAAEEMKSKLQSI
jgi:non-canonical purine NTP pyrophosphatase (RdgB/HAM1 family)